MTLFKRVIWCVFLFLAFSSCVPQVKRSFYPEDILGTRIAFYPSNEGRPSERNSPKKDMLFYFRRDGSFTGTLNGELYEIGNYTYHLKKGSNLANLVISYSERGESFTYTFSMLYKSAFSGSWEIVHTNDSNIKLKENGTFRFVK